MPMQPWGTSFGLSHPIHMPACRCLVLYYCFMLHLWHAADGKQPQADAGFFARREFCFTMDGDIFVRYQSFKVR